MNYDETDLKRILRETQDDLLALVAVDAETTRYEVVYSDNSYKTYGNHYQKEDFFGKWYTVGIKTVHPHDQERMLWELSLAHVRKRLAVEDSFSTVCRFRFLGRWAYCCVKVANSSVEPGVFIISIHNIDYEISQERRRQADERNTAAMLEQLKLQNCSNQITPHYLCNSLSSIREVVLDDPDRGADALYDFALHMRSYVKACAGNERIPFPQELENIEAYVRIEQLRLGERLSMVYEIDSSSFAVPPLSIQPFVENAIKHGVFGRGPRGGTVVLRTSESPEFWLVSVEDDGVGFECECVQEEYGQSDGCATGMQNAKARLEAIGGTVEVHSVVDEGTEVIVRIPKAQADDGEFEPYDL